MTVLNISNNSLSTVLELAELTALKEVDLYHNHIETLTGAVFSKLFDLQKVSLNNNQLQKVDVGGFFNTLSLEYLDVLNNNLGSFRLNGIFPELPELQINNKLLSITV